MYTDFLDFQRTSWTLVHFMQNFVVHIFNFLSAVTQTRHVNEPDERDTNVIVEMVSGDGPTELMQVFWK